MKYTIFKLLVHTFMLALALFACREQDEMFRQYVTEGGIVYPCKAMEPNAFPGIGRVDLSWLNPTSTVTAACIWWNNYEDSVLVNVSAQMDTIRQSVTLPEGIYSFIIRTFDKDGNQSVPVEVIGRSIGDKYLSTFFVRPTIGYKTKGGGNLTIEWDDIEMDKGPLYSEVVYTATDGSEKTIQAPASDKTTVIDDYKLDAGFRYTTFYQPDPQNPLVVNPPYREVTAALVALDKSIGRVVAFSDEWPDASTRATGAYDGKTSKSRWHSLNNGYPHWVTIDLGAEVNIVRLDIWPSDYDGVIDNRMPNRIRWEVSTGNTMPESWTSLGDFDYDRSTSNWAVRPYDVTPSVARYVKLTGLSDPGDAGGIMCLGEIDVYTKLGE